VVQVCEQGRVDWVEQPGANRKLDDLKFPAPVLELMPAAGGHAH
jgi:uncharacterized protein YcnI